MCKYGRKCKIKNCPLKHEEEEEKPECLNYKQGFCYNGKSCRLRHVKRQPEECPALFDFNQSIAEGKHITHVLTKVPLINNCTNEQFCQGMYQCRRSARLINQTNCIRYLSVFIGLNMVRRTTPESTVACVLPTACSLIMN